MAEKAKLIVIDLSHGAQPGKGRTNRGPHDRRFRDRGIFDPVGAKIIVKALVTA